MVASKAPTTVSKQNKIAKELDVSKSAVKHNRAIFITLKAVVNSNAPLGVVSLQQVTGFDKRMVQRHVEVLTDVGVIERLGSQAQSGYRYTSALLISAG